MAFSRADRDFPHTFNGFRGACLISSLNKHVGSRARCAAPKGRNIIAQGASPGKKALTPPSPARAGEGKGEREGLLTQGFPPSRPLPPHTFNGFRGAGYAARLKAVP